MKIELNGDELALIASGLKALSYLRTSEAKRGDSLKALEIQGRKLTTKFLNGVDIKKDGRKVETLFVEARDSFCGICDDEEL